ncbi:MAG: Gfo/Idh/MocA family oxidoreductase [Gemmatimonadota bacterium]
MSANPVRIAFIGAGDVSALHGEAVRRCPGAELAGLWNRTRSRGEKRAAELGCRLYRSAEELVADPAVDAVFVLTNLETHLEYGLMALEAGKHVLVEKPVGVTVGQIERLAAAAAARGRVCMPGHNYIYEESLARAADLVRRGDLGRVVAVYVLYNIHHPESVAARFPGVIRQILTHHAYILLYLAGPATCLAATRATLHYERIPQEDIAMVNLRMASGALAHLSASFAADDHSADPWTVVVKVIGTAGSTRYSYRDWVQLKPGTAHSQTYSAYQGSIDNEVRYFAERCVRQGEAPLSTLADAAAAQRIVEAAELSAAENRFVEL